MRVAELHFLSDHRARYSLKDHTRLLSALEEECVQMFYAEGRQQVLHVPSVTMDGT
jgi:hypothetical protein